MTRVDNLNTILVSLITVEISRQYIVNLINLCCYFSICWKDNINSLTLDCHKSSINCLFGYFQQNYKNGRVLDTHFAPSKYERPFVNIKNRVNRAVQIYTHKHPKSSWKYLPLRQGQNWVRKTKKGQGSVSNYLPIYTQNSCPKMGAGWVPPASKFGFEKCR